MKDRLKSIFEIPVVGRLHALEGLRAYAIMLAFFVHYFSYYSQNILGYNANYISIKNIAAYATSWIDYLSYYLFRSHYGVYIFFVISGFLIGRLLLKKRINYINYLGKRIIRIYPVFFVTYILATFVRTQFVGQREFEFQRFIEGLLLLDVWYNVPAWSLQYEVVFYTIVPFIFLPIIIITNRSKTIFLITSFALILISMYELKYIRAIFFLPGLYISLFNDEELKSIAERLPVSFVIIFYLLSTTSFMFYPKYYALLPIMCISFGLLFIKITFDRGLLNKIFSNTYMRYLGNISYSFYLVHGFIIWIVFKKILPHSDSYNHVIYLILTIMLSFVISVILAIIIFSLFEKPYFMHKHKLQNVKRNINKN